MLPAPHGLGDWTFPDFNGDPQTVEHFLQTNNAGNTSVSHRQNRALMFDSMLFHESNPFRFKSGEWTRIVIGFTFYIPPWAWPIRVEGQCRRTPSKKRPPPLHLTIH